MKVKDKEIPKVYHTLIEKNDPMSNALLPPPKFNTKLTRVERSMISKIFL